MKIIRNLNRVRKFKDPVAAIGVFDGLHLGHRQILKSVVKKAKDIKGTPMVITFYPHPQKEYDIYSLEHRLKLIEEIGINVCFVMSFNKAFENMEPEEFIRKILVDKIAPKYIFVGDNFVFGKRARGNIGLLEDYSSLYGFKVKAIKLLRKNKKAISSTLIRKLIRRGQFKTAEKLLGRRVSILGRVIKGFSLGRRMGFPTANINPQHDIIPASGIYAVKVFLIPHPEFHGLRPWMNGEWGRRLTRANKKGTTGYTRGAPENKEYSGVCYIGNKPTLKIGRKHVFIEAHLFNFKGNIYGRELEIKFIRKLRGEQKFASIEALAGQIKKDIIFAKKVISSP